MINYDKLEIRESLEVEQIFELLEELGGEPEYQGNVIISRTICHNHPQNDCSRKLYYYLNSNLFHCYTGCDEPSFDVFQLIIKIAEIQWNINYDLNDAVRWIAQRFGIIGTFIDSEDQFDLEDWDYFSNQDRIKDIEYNKKQPILKEYNPYILQNFNYNVNITPWEKEGIKREVIKNSQISYYPGGEKIVIPHFDKDNRLIGIRGRTLSDEEGEMFGKYRPLKVNRQLYNHPLGMNLYNLNHSKDIIKIVKKAIIFESEKSTLQYRSYFGEESDISVACCGSNLSSYQVESLLDLGVQEIIIGFDRQFKNIGDNEFIHLKNNLLKIREKYHKDTLVSFIFDKNKITQYKDSPTDRGAEIFMNLYKNRIIL